MVGEGKGALPNLIRGPQRASCAAFRRLVAVRIML